MQEHYTQRRHENADFIATISSDSVILFGVHAAYQLDKKLKNSRIDF